MIGLEDALEASRVLSMLISGRLLEVVQFGDIDLSMAMRLAHDERITFYDASYIAAAWRWGLRSHRLMRG